MLEVDSRSGREDQRGGRRGAVSKKERFEGGGNQDSLMSWRELHVMVRKHP